MLTDKEIRNIIAQGPESTFIFIKELVHKTDQIEKRIQVLEAIINKNSQRSAANLPAATSSRTIKTIPGAEYSDSGSTDQYTGSGFNPARTA